jgi:hypothetical protein
MARLQCASCGRVGLLKAEDPSNPEWIHKCAVLKELKAVIEECGRRVNRNGGGGRLADFMGWLEKRRDELAQE